MRQRHYPKRDKRSQVTKAAVIAFLAADCAGIAYVQHRLSSNAAAAARLAYETPGLADASALTFRPDAPLLALKAPAAVPAAVVVPQAAPAQAPAAATTQAAAPLLARAAISTPAPAAVATLHRAATVHSLAAPRVERLAGLGPARATVSLPTATKGARQEAHHVAASSVADSAFANAFSLYDEAPDAEHRFSQDSSGAEAAPGSLSSLVAPREDATPIFDKAGIAPVEGQAAAVDAAAAAETPADAAAAELQPTKG